MTPPGALPAIRQTVLNRAAVLKTAATAINPAASPVQFDWKQIPASAPWAREFFPLLWYGAVAGKLPPPPDRLGIELLDAYATAVEITASRSMLLELLTQRLANQNITICLIKGAALAKQVYPCPHLRAMSDLDVLARPADLQLVNEACRVEGGFREGATPAHVRWRFDSFNGTIVEVHVRLWNPASILQRLFMPAEFLDNIPWNNAIPIASGCLALPPDYHRVYLWLHTLREGYASLKWILDDILLTPLAPNPGASDIPHAAIRAGMLMAKTQRLLETTSPAANADQPPATRAVTMAAAGVTSRPARALLMTLAMLQ